MERDGQGRRTLGSVWPQAEAEPGNLKSDLDKARVRQRTGVGPLHLSLFFSCFLRFLGLLPVSLARHWYSCGYLELRSSDKQPKQTWKSLQTANIQQKQQIMEIFIRCNFKTKLSVCYQNHRVIGVQKFLFTAVASRWSKRLRLLSNVKRLQATRLKETERHKIMLQRDLRGARLCCRLLLPSVGVWRHI